MAFQSIAFGISTIFYVQYIHENCIWKSNGQHSIQQYLHSKSKKKLIINKNIYIRYEYKGKRSFKIISGVLYLKSCTQVVRKVY